MRIAAIADIYGNMPALKAVLADIQRRDIDPWNPPNFLSPPMRDGICNLSRTQTRKALALQIVGLMFWFSRNRLVGSYLFLSATSRP